jgi:hypothetical protein
MAWRSSSEVNTPMHQQGWLIGILLDAEQMILRRAAEKIESTPTPKTERVRKPEPQPVLA